MRSYWVKVGPNPMTGVRIRRENRDKDTQGKDSHVQKPRNARDGQQPPEAERQETDSSSELLEGT